MAVIAIQDLLEAGVHFGHQTRKRNPKMTPFIFEDRNGLHIINLQKTQRLLDYATQYARNIAQRGGKILFVGTKPQIKSVIREMAVESSMPYVCERWLGGTLTNISTIRQSINRLEEIEELEKNGILAKLPKKEQASLNRELSKLHRNLDGIRAMDEIPEAIFVVDTLKERIAVAEARKLGLTIIAICDTNSNPDLADFIIPGNDDAISSVKLIVSAISKAVSEGVQFHDEVEKQRQQRIKESKEKSAKTKKKTSRKKRSEESKKLQDELSAVAEASAEPTEE
jgi:small subunit ribosomal protein S2